MKPALLIIDVQTALCSGDDAAVDIDRVVGRINEVAAKARRAGAPVILVQHEESEGPLQVGTPTWALYEALVIEPSDRRIGKRGSDAFHHTELQSLLQSLSVDALVICGLQSEFCIDSTVRRALALGYPVTLVADGHSTLNTAVLSAAQVSAHHNETLANLTSYGPRATPVNACDIEFAA